MSEISAKREARITYAIAALMTIAWLGCSAPKTVEPTGYCAKLTSAACDAVTECCGDAVDAEAICRGQREGCEAMVEGELLASGRVTIRAREFEATLARMRACETPSSDDVRVIYEGHVALGGDCGSEALSPFACVSGSACVDSVCTAVAERGARCEERPCAEGLQCVEMPGEDRDALVLKCIGAFASETPCRHPSECASGSCTSGRCADTSRAPLCPQP